MCVQYVRRNSLERFEVCEEFLGFCTVLEVNAEAITSAIVGLVTTWKVHIAKTNDKLKGPSCLLVTLQTKIWYITQTHMQDPLVYL